MMRRPLLWLSVLGILVLLLAACGTPELAPAEEARRRLPRKRRSARRRGSGEAPAAEEAAAGIPDVPRDRTLIMAGLGGEHFGGFTDVDLFNYFDINISRGGFTQACTEGLFYYNMIGDDLPSLAGRELRVQ